MNRNKAYIDMLEEQIDKMITSGIAYARLVRKGFESDKFKSCSFLLL